MQSVYNLSDILALIAIYMLFSYDAVMTDLLASFTHLYFDLSTVKSIMISRQPSKNY